MAERLDGEIQQMNPLINNEILGTIALQATLTNLADRKLDLTKALLILPLFFNKRTRSLMKNKNVKIISSKDLVLSFPKEFIGIRTHYLDFATTSLNTVLLACEMKLVTFEEGTIALKNVIYTSPDVEVIGKTASDIFLAAPKIAKILEEDVVDLYENFRITL